MHLLQTDNHMSRATRALLCIPAKQAWMRLALALFVALAALPGATSTPVKASENQRIVRTTRTVLAYHWNLLRWSTGSPVCDFHVEGAGLPSLEEVRINCSTWTYDTWSKTPICSGAAEGNAGECTGLFLVYLGTEVAEVIEEVSFPPPTVTVEPTNCRAWEWCSERPYLAFLGIEPMPDQAIKAIHVKIGGQERICTASTCELRMPLTGDQGVQLEFWAVSSYGDEGPHQVLPLRNRTPTSKPEQYKLELLGDSWVNTAPTGAVRWGMFPSVTNSMAPLIEPLTSPADLASQRSYLYLSGSLIRKGLVNALGCPDGGLNQNGTANTCGEERAQAKALEWQNRYDGQIFAAAQTYGVPARLLKALIARETQFWPDSGTPYELGLGRITENGADLLLSWNLPYYLNMCTLQYNRNLCAGGYSFLSETRQTLLRGKALSAVGTKDEINLIAATLNASSAQVTQMIKNVSSKEPVSVSSLEDMWALTIGNYHTGSGCVGASMGILPTHTLSITWSEVASHFTSGCQAGKTYVDEVMALAK